MHKPKDTATCDYCNNNLDNGNTITLILGKDSKYKEGVYLFCSDKCLVGFIDQPDKKEIST